MNVAWGEIILVTCFMATAIALRIWAAHKYVKVKDQIENSGLQEAYDALHAFSDTTFIFLIMALAWIANEALSRL
ncbi:MAG: hypothetical protein HW411_111 [Gammaproteobacteria bacterium]|nr:hypothetical protein [Gammaproteobacteria bacterium]